MKTVDIQTYKALNEVHRNGESKSKDIPMFDYLLKRGWIGTDKAFNEICLEKPKDQLYVLTSSGRLEHNLYEKEFGVTDTYKRRIS